MAVGGDAKLGKYTLWIVRAKVEPVFAGTRTLYQRTVPRTSVPSSVDFGQLNGEMIRIEAYAVMA
jgi:hypothetical protein